MVILLLIKNIDQSKIKAHLGNKVKSWITKDKFKKSDIDRIVHIVDMMVLI